MAVAKKDIEDPDVARRIMGDSIRAGEGSPRAARGHHARGKLDESRL